MQVGTLLTDLIRRNIIEVKEVQGPGFDSKVIQKENTDFLLKVPVAP